MHACVAQPNFGARVFCYCAWPFHSVVGRVVNGYPSASCMHAHAVQPNARSGFGVREGGNFFGLTRWTRSVADENKIKNVVKVDDM